MADPVSERYKEALRMGHIAVVRGRPAEALAHYEEAGRLAGHRALPFVSMGGVLLQMRRHQEALVAFDEALRRAPDDVAALRGRMQALEASGRKKEAAALNERLSRLEAAAASSADRAPAQAPSAAADAERHALEAAAAAARGAVRPAVAGYLQAAQAYAGANALDASLDACFRALELSPGDPAIHLQMAAVYLQRGWRQHALERLTLIDRILRLEDRPDVRAGFESLVRTHRAQLPELAGLAPPPS